MDRDSTRALTVAGLGGALTVVGVGAYLTGVLVAYPGRSFSVTGVMVGITLLAIGNAMGQRGEP